MDARRHSQKPKADVKANPRVFFRSKVFMGLDGEKTLTKPSNISKLTRTADHMAKPRSAHQ
jgi:hypothetical protein